MENANEKDKVPVEERFNATIVQGGKRGVNWQKSTSPYGYILAEALSATIKEIRRGHEEEAVFWAHQLAISGREAEAFLWECLRVSAIEDCGLANPDALGIVNDAMDLYNDLPERSGRRFSTLAFAVVYLARSKKSRYSNELFQDVVFRIRNESPKLDVPDYALDHHVRRGRERRRGIHYYLTVAAQLTNEDTSFPTKYRERLIERAQSEENPL